MRFCPEAWPPEVELDRLVIIGLGGLFIHKRPPPQNSRIFCAMDGTFLRQLEEATKRFVISRRKLIAPGRRRAAVLAPLMAVDGAPSLLFTVRSGSVGTHKSQVSFPGGHIEGSESEREAAVRECHEEVGLRARALGEHNDVIAVTGTLVTPVLGFFDGSHAAKDLLATADNYNAAEVAEVFTLSLEHLLNPAHVSLESLRPTPQRPSITMPVFTGGPQRVWGLTAVILAGMLSDLVVPAWVASGGELLPGAAALLQQAADAPFHRDTSRPSQSADDSRAASPT
jgi:nudix motif 8